MKQIISAVILGSLSISSAFATQESNNVATANESYALGYMQGQQLSRLNDDLKMNFDMKEFNSGFESGFNKKENKLKQNMQSILLSLQQKINEKHKNLLDAKFAENKTKGEEFFKKIKAEKGANAVQELSDGVLYTKLQNSSKTNQNPKLTDTVVVNYIGKTIDNQEFEKRNDVSFPLNSVIKGWQVALQKMSPGDKWRVYIPANMAYGAHGTPTIMPNSALIFDIELVAIKDQKADKKA